MSPVEFIGFIISMIALIILFFRNRYEAKRRQEHPEEFLDETAIDEDDPIKDLLRSVEKELGTSILNQTKKEKIEVKKQSKVEKQKSQIQSTGSRDYFSRIEERKLKSSIATRRMESELDKRKLSSGIAGRRLKSELPSHSHRLMEEGRIEIHSRASDALKKLPDLKQMVIYHEILGKPKGF